MRYYNLHNSVSSPVTMAISIIILLRVTDHLCDGGNSTLSRKRYRFVRAITVRGNSENTNKPTTEKSVSGAANFANGRGGNGATVRADRLRGAQMLIRKIKQSERKSIFKYIGIHGVFKKKSFPRGDRPGFSRPPSYKSSPCVFHCAANHLPKI